MPYSEKYANALDFARLTDTFVLPLIEKHLGDEGVTEVQRIWEERLEPVPEDASFEKKYETAYRNWIWKWAQAVNFMRDKLGENGVEEFKRAAVEALKRKSSGPALFLLKFMRALSKETAFRILAKQLAYQLQMYGPYNVSELTGRRLVINMPHCKLLDFPGGEEACVIGCQSNYPRWLAEQFKVKYVPERQGKRCTLTLTPL